MPINKETLALYQALAQGFTSIPFTRVLGLCLDKLDENQIIMSFCMKEELVGNFMLGILHGGVIASVLDMAGGMMVIASAIRKYPKSNIDKLKEIVSHCSTIDLHVNYVNPGKGETFIAKSWLIKSGHTISFTRMELLNQDENLIATANGTYLLK